MFTTPEYKYYPGWYIWHFLLVRKSLSFLFYPPEREVLKWYKGPNQVRKDTGSRVQITMDVCILRVFAGVTNPTAIGNADIHSDDVCYDTRPSVERETVALASRSGACEHKVRLHAGPGDLHCM